VETANSRSNTLLQGVWHQAVKTNWAWKFGLLLFLIFNIIWNIAEPLRIQYYASRNIIYESDYPMSIAAVAVVTLLLALAGICWADRNKVPVMLRYEDTGITFQLKTGVVVEAGWNAVRRVQLDRWTGVTSIFLRATIWPYTGQFPPDVGRALAAEARRRRRGLPVPAEPEAQTLEEKVDGRLSGTKRW
jgi:hypothetical protein